VRVGGNLYNSSYHNFGPQIGFAWSPGQLPLLHRDFHNRMVIRGGFGIGYSQKIVTATSVDYYVHQQDGLFATAVTNAKAAADHHAIVEISMQQRELTGAPGKTNLRSEIMVAGVVEIPANAHGCAREWGRTGAGDCDVKVAKLFVNGTEVFPSHAKTDRKVGLQLPIVLKKERITIWNGM